MRTRFLQGGTIAAIGFMILALGCGGEPDAPTADRSPADLGMHATTSSYTVTDISPTSTSYEDSYAWGINDSRVVVGWSNLTTGIHGWVISTPGAPTWLVEPLGAIGSEGLGIASNGGISGEVYYGNGVFLPAYWPTSTTPPRIIPTPPGSQGGIGYGVNSSGQVVGMYVNSSGYAQAFIWNLATNTTTSLGTFGGVSSTAWAITDEGKVFGCANNAAGDQLAFGWTLATGLVMLQPGIHFSCAYGADIRGDAAGDVQPSTVDSAAEFLAHSSPRHFLPRRALGATLYDLNDDMTAVGALTTAGGQVAFAADPGLVTLNLPLIKISSGSIARAINRCGAITGYEIDTKVRALLWVPPGC